MGAPESWFHHVADGVSNWWFPMVENRLDWSPYIPVILTIITVAGGAIGVGYQAWANRSRDVSHAEASNLAVEAASEMINQLRKARDYWKERALRCEEKL